LTLLCIIFAVDLRRIEYYFSSCRECGVVRGRVDAKNIYCQYQTRSLRCCYRSCFGRILTSRDAADSFDFIDSGITKGTNAPGCSSIKQPHQKYFVTNDHKMKLNELKVSSFAVNFLVVTCRLQEKLSSDSLVSLVLNQNHSIAGLASDPRL